MTVTLSPATGTVRPLSAKSDFVPLTSGVPEQSGVRKMLTVEPDSAWPTISGLLSLAGPTGLVAARCGDSGAVESSTYVTAPVEQAETLPASSVTVAWKVVVVSSSTWAAIPVAEKADSGPVAAGVPLQSPVAYRFTVEPDSAVPWISGSFWFAGEAGTVAVSVGGSAWESSTYSTDVVEQVETLPAASVVVAWKVVVVLSSTWIAMPVELKVAAGPA